jgi:hypothetical protein
VSAFFYIVLTCVGSYLETGRSPFQGFLSNVQKQIHKFQKSNSESEKARGPTPNLFYSFYRSRFLLERLIVTQLAKIFPALYGSLKNHYHIHWSLPSILNIYVTLQNLDKGMLHKCLPVSEAFDLKCVMKYKNKIRITYSYILDYFFFDKFGCLLFVMNF